MISIINAETPNTSQTLPSPTSTSTDEEDLESSITKKPLLRLNIDGLSQNFPEVDINVNVPR